MGFWLRLVLPILSAVVLAAHWYRPGQIYLAAFCVVVPLLLLTRRLWSVTALQTLLAFGAVEWVETALRLGRMRQMMGVPATRMTAILVSVAVLTALSVLLLASPRVRSRFD
jgi:hypothetical protein